MGDTSTEASNGTASPVAFGKAAKELFLIDPNYHNLNHGSFGATPRAIQRKMHEYQERSEARPDTFIRFELPKLIDESRAAVAAVLRAPTDTVVFVPNASVGINTVLRNLQWNDDAQDEILHLHITYGGVLRTVDYIVESQYGRVSSRSIDFSYPCEDATVLEAFHKAVAESKSAGKRPRICIFDTVSSLPGIAVPYAELVAACKTAGILSMVDGAQGAGLIDLDLGKVDPDFFVSNCHKWLYAPRGCAVLFVPFRNQHMIVSSLPTSHGYVTKAVGRLNPLPPSTKSPFVRNFEFVGSQDWSSYCCVKDAIQWRQGTFGSEERIIKYQTSLAKEGGKRVAEILGTWVLDNAQGTLTECGMVNVALPFVMSGTPAAQARKDFGAVAAEDATSFQVGLQTELVDNRDTFLPVYDYQGQWFIRLSAQVYLEMEDFEWAGNVVKEVCAQAAGRLSSKE